jgi:hypothetical protein
MPRSWFSFPIPHTRIRVGRSYSDAELFGTSRRREALPAWIKYELRDYLQTAAKERGDNTMTKERADYLIDKAYALGEISGDGLNIQGCGNNADEIARDIVAKYAVWGIDMPYENALVTANEGIRRADRRRRLWRWRRIAWRIIIPAEIAVFIVLTFLIYVG